MAQEARVTQNETRNGRLTDTDVDFFRDGDFQFCLVFKSKSTAESVAKAWNEGAKQWEIAEMLKKMGEI